DKEPIDTQMEHDIDNIFHSNTLDINYKEAVLVTISTDNNKGKNAQDNNVRVLAYKVKGDWYFAPGIYDYIVSCRQDEDLFTAMSLATSIQTVLSNEYAYDSMYFYRDVVISLDDLEYLPQEFQDEFKFQIDNTDLSLRHKDDGAIGYAFKVFESGSVEVFISSDTKMDEWRVCPEVDSDYYKGIKDEVSDTALSSEYSYVKLISEQSPIMGYWQSDKAGMYIGYNVSGGGEGFTVYLQSQDVDFQLLHRYEDYTYSGGNGNIKFSKNTDYYNVVYDIQVVDNNTIELTVTNGGYDGTVNTEYTFKKGEIPRELLAQFEGTWIDGGEVFGSWANPYGEVVNLVCCDECGSLHGKDSSEAYNYNFHQDEYISIYDGKDLHYYFLYEGLWIVEDEYEWAYPYDFNMVYSVNGDMLVVRGFTSQAIGIDYTCFREDSEQAQVAEALNAYQEYITNNTEFFVGVELVYVDGDVIPECIVKCQFDTASREREYMLTYYGGQVVVLDNSMTASSISLKDGLNEIKYDYQGSMLDLEGTEIYTLEEGVFKQKIEIYRSLETPDSTEYVWYVDGDKVDEGTYNQTLDNMGEFPIAVTGQYGSLRDAYNDLKKPIDTSKYDTSSSVVVEEGDTIWVSVESIYSGAGGDGAWENQGELEFVVSIDTYEFDQTDYGLTYDEKNANVNLAIGKKVGDVFELTFNYGDGSRTYRYTILGIDKN
ncbi:MAG: hypothetical protein IJ040_00960, partial [Lachnospiraceae bacterium]|nr:hypothetical protein [Lachnospiraceae bacterium]